MKNLYVDHQRLWDLVRYERAELHDLDLITDAEYALLAEDHPAVARLEEYDHLMFTEAQLQKEVGRLGTELVVAMSTIARLQAEHDARMESDAKQSV
jgi:hypothetical protein